MLRALLGALLAALLGASAALPRPGRAVAGLAGRALLRELRDAAARGVRVRLLVNGL